MVASEGDPRVDVDPSDAHGEVDGEVPIVDSGNSDDLPATDTVAHGDRCCGQVGVRGLDPTVVDRHRAIHDHDADE